MILTAPFVILMILVFVLMYLFAKTIDHRKGVILVIALVLTPLIYFYVVYPLLNIFSSYHHEKYFDKMAWKEKPAVRYEMSGDIIDKKLLKDRSKTEVEHLLGTCDWYSWDDSLKMNSPDLWNYNLGVKPGAFNRANEYLEISFENNRAKHIKQYQIEKTFE